ncbi:MAG: hypothetical protein ACE366_03230 [Bradymonadia bacterium]
MNELTFKAALRDEAAARALVGLVFDFASRQPVRRFLKPERVLVHLDAALDEGALETLVERHLSPWFDREEVRLEGRKEERLRDWLTAEAIAELRALAAKPVRLEKAQVERFVQQPGVKSMITSVVKESIEKFISAFNPSNLFGGRRGLGLMGNITAQFESQIQRAARSFIDNSMDMMISRVVQMITSPETARQMGRAKLNAFEQGLEQRIYDLWRMSADNLPRADLMEILPGLIAHNLARPELRDALLEEMNVWLEIEGDRTTADLLTEMHVLEAWRTEIIDIAAPVLVELADDADFDDWIARFVAPE